MGKIYTVILAAGISSRLGFNKLTLKIDGQTVIKKSIAPFVTGNVEKIIVVTGAEGDNIKRELEGFTLKFINNPHYMEGMSASIKAALPFISDADGVFFHLGDKPFVKQETIHLMLNSYINGGANMVVPVYKNVKGHPVLMCVNPYIEEMRLLKGDKGLREIIEKHLEDVLFVEGDEGNVFDIDNIEDVNILKERGYKIEEG
jgi:molybdenum cofactor cytidylyltransferase